MTQTRQANPWAALVALCIGFFMILLDTTIVSVAIPAMLHGLNASLNSVVWVTSVYLLTYAVPMLFTSRLGDRFGPKRMFLIGLVIFTGASLWCGVAGTVEMLIAARAVQGIGAAIMTPQTLLFITHLFPPAKRGAPMGMWGGVAGLATITGPLLGGVLVEHLGWEWIFFVNVPIGVVALAMVLILVPDWQPKHAHSFDVPGILLSCVGLLLLVFGLQNGKQYDWGEVRYGITIPEIIGAGALLLIVFLVWQRFNKREPLLPLRLFGHRNFSTGSMAAFTIGFAMIGMFLPLVIFIQSVLKFTPVEAGLVTAPMSLLSGVIAPFIGRLSDRISGKFIVMFGLVVLAGGLGIIAAQARPEMNAAALIPALLVCGLGVGCVFSPLSNLTMSAVEPRLAGAASGVFNTARQVGGVVGSAAVGVLLQITVSTYMRDAAEQRAGELPAAFRGRFVDAMSNAGGGGEFGGGSAPELPAGIPDGLRERLGAVATDVFHQGFTDAARVTLLLPAAVLLLGAIACVFMRRTARPATAPASTVEAVPAETAAESTLDIPAVAEAPDRLVHGTISAHGVGIGDVAVTLVDDAGAQIGRTATHADGRYAIEAHRPGDYLLIAAAPAHTPVAEPLSVNGGPVRKDLSLASTIGVRGTVRTTAGGPPPEATSVSLLNTAGEVVASAMVDAGGGYALAGATPGSYTLVVAAPHRAAVAEAVRVAADAPAVQDIVLTDVARLHGTAHSTSGHPIRQAMVTVLDGGGKVVATTLTGDTGTYTIDGLPEGDYTVIASGYPPIADKVRLHTGPHDHDLLLHHPTPTP